MPNTNTAARGAALLDRVKPGWFHMVNLATLDIMDGANCILGQVFREEAQETGVDAGYFYATNHDLETGERLPFDVWDNENHHGYRSSAWISAHGFVPYPFTDQEIYNLWAFEIIDRRLKHAQIMEELTVG